MVDRIYNFCFETYPFRIVKPICYRLGPSHTLARTVRETTHVSELPELAIGEQL